VVELQGHPDYAAAVPTPDHFLPLLYLAGMADADGAGCDVLVDGYAFGSLSMACYSLGADCPSLDELTLRWPRGRRPSRR
jgi:4,5-DOPA dioxygenase extradiol